MTSLKIDFDERISYSEKPKKLKIVAIDFGIKNQFKID